MAQTAIEWATHTMNHQAGCTKASPACKHCYAIPLSVRIKNMGQSSRYIGVTNEDLKNPKWTGVINADISQLKKNFAEIKNASKPRRTFYGSMTDLFHESLDIHGVELSSLAQEVANLSCKTSQVIMILTKRPAKLLEWQQHYFPNGLPSEIWVGATVEDQQRADERLPILTQVKASVRFLSCEPLFEEVNLKNEWLQNIEWVIAGGESGNKARVANPDWFRSLRDQSVSAGIPFHFKQWGEWDENMTRIGKKKAGRVLDGRTWDEHP
tara:strand:- start:547 stop:1350 length:804 start_codon:yes stop_codon:yes gene_type:complete